MNTSRGRKGEIFIILAVLAGALFPVITILSYNTLSPLVSFAGSTFFAAVFFAVVLTIRKKWHELKNKAALKDVLLTTLIIGIIYYLLFFFGLRHTSAGNASIIVLTEIFFSYFFFHVWRKDHLPSEHKIGIVLMATGALIVLYPTLEGFTGGEILILIASFIAPLGNFFQQRARRMVSSESIMFVRSLIGTLFIFSLILIFKQSISYPDLKSSIIPLLINGIFLFGLSKIFWIEGIHRINVTKANALGSISPLFTLVFAWILLKDIPTVWQLLSLAPMTLGVIFLGMNKKNN